MRDKPQELEAQVVDGQANDWRPDSAVHRSDKTITICVTDGRSKHKTHRLKKSRATIGRMGGGADMQVDDSDVSPVHCAVAIAQEGVRIYDLESANGTYVDDEEIQMADLENLSVFRLGSTEFVVLIVPKVDGA
jgi:pSer/pThr/pTyr-binding forkhead associated (FHA) protein